MRLRVVYAHFTALSLAQLNIAADLPLFWGPSDQQVAPNKFGVKSD